MCALRLLTLLLLSVPHLGAAAAARAECFPIERLRPNLRDKAAELLLEALDSPALYTLVGGLKPLSWGYASPGGRATYFVARYPDLNSVQDFQQILTTWRCGDELTADITVWPRQPLSDGTLTAAPFVANLPAVRNVIRQRPELYGRHGITEFTDPGLALATIDRTFWLTSKPSGHRMFGYLLGYPGRAVEWYADAGGQQAGSTLVSIPSYERRQSFQFTVPKGYLETGEDKQLRTRAAQILAEYTKRRAQYIGAGKPGVLALLRDWFCDAAGKCAPSQARW
jgi:hypothetical protein